MSGAATETYVVSVSDAARQSDEASVSNAVTESHVTPVSDASSCAANLSDTATKSD